MTHRGVGGNENHDANSETDQPDILQVENNLKGIADGQQLHKSSHGAEDHISLHREPPPFADYYSDDHVETIMRRAAARGIKLRKILFLALWFFGCQEFEKVHPLQGGILRRKYRRDRRYGMPLESRFIFYPRYAWETLVKSLKFLRLGLKYARIRSRILREQGLEDYTDLALSPVCDDDLDVLELYSSTESAKAAVKKVRQRDQERARQAVAAAE